MDTYVVFYEIFVLLLIIAVGFATSKFGIINSEVNKRLTQLLLNITLPFLIVTSFQFEFSIDMLVNAGIIFICSTGMFVLSIILSELLYRRMPGGIKSVLKFVTVFSNCGFMGFPILDALYGKTGVFYISIFLIPFNLFVWSYGVLVFSRAKNAKTIKKIFLNPGIIAVSLGIILFIFSVKLPYSIYKAMNLVGSMTTPLSMIIVGAILAQLDFKSIFSGIYVYYGVAIRLVVLPLMVLCILKIIDVEDTMLGTMVIIAAMPAAANTALFANIYEGDSLFASKAVGITTLISTITLPLIIILMGNI